MLVTLNNPDKGFRRALLATLILVGLITCSSANQVLTRVGLQALLGPGSTVDTFEDANLAPDSQVSGGQSLEYGTVISNSATHVVSKDSQYTSEIALFMQNILGSASTNLSAYGSQPVSFFPSGLTPAVGLELANYGFVGPSTGIVHFKRFGVEVGSVQWNINGLVPAFFGWYDPLGIDEVVIEPTNGTYPPLIDNVEFKVVRPSARAFYSLDLNGHNLVKIDPVNGHVEYIGNLGIDGLIDADLTWFNGYLYAAVVQAVGPFGNWQSRLMKIDPATGLVVDIHTMAPVDNYLDYVEGIAVANGRLIISTPNQYGFASYASDGLWDVNPSTGLLTNLHSYRPNDYYADMDCLEGLPNGDLLSLDNEPGSYKRFIRVGSGPYFYDIVNVSFNNRASINDWVIDGGLLVGPNDYTDSVGTFDALTGHLLYSVSTGPGNYRGAALPPSNRAPVANAGLDASVFCCGTTTLDGSGSSDPDGDALSYSWYEGGTLISTLASPTVSLAAGVHTLSLVVTDPSNLASTDTVVVTKEAMGFEGFLPPIGGADSTGGSFANPLRAFKLGSTIPIKFKGVCCGNTVLTGIHTLQATKYSNSVDSDPPIDATPTDAATTGNQFRLTGDQWHFNMSTVGLSSGTWKLTATLSDGSRHFVWITIKP